MVDHYVLRARFSRFVMSLETASYTASSSHFVSRKVWNTVLSICRRFREGFSTSQLAVRKTAASASGGVELASATAIVVARHFIKPTAPLVGGGRRRRQSATLSWQVRSRCVEGECA